MDDLMLSAHRVQVALEACPSVLSEEQVQAITKGLEHLVSHYDATLTGKQLVALTRGTQQMLDHYGAALGVRIRCASEVIIATSASMDVRRPITRETDSIGAMSSNSSHTLSRSHR